MQPNAGIPYAELVETCFRTFVPTPRGQRLLARYESVRRHGRANYEAVLALPPGPGVTERVFATLLPHRLAIGGTRADEWLHVRADERAAADRFFEDSWRVNPRDLPDLAVALLRFFRQTLAEPERLAVFAAELADERGAGILDAALVSPLLHAIRPGLFPPANAYTAAMAAALMGCPEDLGLAAYHRLNLALVRCVDALVPDGDGVWSGAVERSDRFDLFAYWLAAIHRPEVAAAASIEPDQPKNEALATAGGAIFGEVARVTGLPVSFFERLDRLLARFGQVALWGPPAVGKTFVAERYARLVAEARRGTFALCAEADTIEPDELQERLASFLGTVPSAAPALFVVDGVDERPLGTLLGPLRSALAERGRSVTTKSGAEFAVGTHVHLVFTMSTVSPANLEGRGSLRRRLPLVRMPSRPDLLVPVGAVDVPTLVRTANELIGDWRFGVGHGLFVGIDDPVELEDRWTTMVEPQLEAWLAPERMPALRWPRVLGTVAKEKGRE